MAIQTQREGLVAAKEILEIILRSNLSPKVVKAALDQTKTTLVPRTISSPNAQAVKKRLGSLINRIITERGLSSDEAAKVMQTTRARVIQVRKAPLSNVSFDALIDYLVRLGHDVTIAVTPARAGKPGRKGWLLNGNPEKHPSPKPRT